MLLNFDAFSPRARAGMMQTMFGKREPATAEQTARVKAWVATRFALGEDATIMVSADACVGNACMAHETAVVFWGADGRRHQFKILKHVPDIAFADVSALGDPREWPLPEGWVPSPAQAAVLER